MRRGIGQLVCGGAEMLRQATGGPGDRGRPTSARDPGEYTRARFPEKAAADFQGQRDRSGEWLVPARGAGLKLRPGTYRATTYPPRGKRLRWRVRARRKRRLRAGRYAFHQ